MFGEAPYAGLKFACYEWMKSSLCSHWECQEEDLKPMVRTPACSPSFVLVWVLLYACASMPADSILSSAPSPALHPPQGYIRIKQDRMPNKLYFFMEPWHLLSAFVKHSRQLTRGILNPKP
jgi:hypothetical protein